MVSEGIRSNTIAEALRRSKGFGAGSLGIETIWSSGNQFCILNPIIMQHVYNLFQLLRRLKIIDISLAEKGMIYFHRQKVNYEL